MEQFKLLEGTDTLKDSRETINNNLLSVRSFSSGTAFPTDNLSVGMLCYRTDLKRFYQYKEDGSWTADIAMSISGNADTANSAGSAANAERANTADVCTGNAASATTANTANTSQTATALQTPRKINGVSFDGTEDITIDVGVKTVNGNEPSADGDITVSGVPIGFQYFTTNPNIPAGELPLLGSTYSREAYADLWAWVQEQTGYLITEAEWQEKATANDGNVPFYSSGDGSTTFRVPSLSCWIKGANGIEEVGSYLKAGLPNITGTFDSNEITNSTDNVCDGALYGENSSYKYIATGSSGTGLCIKLDASLSNPIYGNSDTVQPPSVVGMWLVKAFGTVSNVGNQDIAEVSSNVARLEEKVTEYTDNVAYIDAFITETWVSDDGSSWYRVWSDNFIEQGGTLANTANETKSLTFAKPFSSTNYVFSRSPIWSKSGSGTYYDVGCLSKTATAITFRTDSTSYYAKYDWYACGY